MLKVGALSESSDTMREDISDLKTSTQGMAQTLDRQTLILERIEDKVDTTAARLDTLECQKPAGGAVCHSPTKAWKRPIGEVAADIAMKSIYVVGVGAIAGAIILAVSKLGDKV